MAEMDSSGKDAGPVKIKQCPDREIWKAICAGEVGDQEAGALLEHAAVCSCCGPELREISAVLADDCNTEELGFLNKLQSGSDAWQRVVALKLREAQAAEHRALPAAAIRRVNYLSWHPRWFAIASIAALVVVVGSFWIYRANHSIDRLLAEAYNRQRLTEIRIPGASPVPLYSPRRGDLPSDPPALTEARLITERALDKNSSDARWNQTLGEIEVLEMRPDAALAHLQIAQNINPLQPRLEFDLGNANFEQGEQGDKTRYPQAIEHYDKFLSQVNGRDPVALYNRALCWQRISVSERARQDFTQALQLEKDPGWRKAIEEQVRSLEIGPKPTSRDDNLPSARPESASDSGDDYENRLRSVLEKGFEDPAPQFSASVKFVADLGLKHFDRWLSDWRIAALRNPQPEANRALARAVRANAQGMAEEAGEDAKIAGRAYLRAGNVAGFERARLEEVYSVRRAGHPQLCLEQLSRISQAGFSKRYAWLAAALSLERASCLSQVGRFDEARNEAQLAWDSANSASLPLLALRARGFVAAFLTSQGLAEEAWDVNLEGLRATTTVSPRDPMRRYQFLSDLSTDASMLGLPQTAAALADQSARVALETNNLQIASYAFELLGEDELAAGRPVEADRAFKRADVVLAGLGNTRATSTYRADWAAARAELQLAQGRNHQSLAILEEAELPVSQTGSFWIEMNYWARRAQIEMRMGRESVALESARKAVDEADAALAKFLSTEEKRAWQRKARPAYVALIDALLLDGHTEDALGRWLWMRGASEATATETLAAPHTIQAITTPGAETLVYARLAKCYVVFCISPGSRPVQIIRLGADPNRLEQMVRNFVILCSDSRSDPAIAWSLGKQLYKELLLPVLGDSPGEIRIDAPPVLDRLPFAALVDLRGQYLGTSTRIVQLPEWWAIRAAPLPASITSASPILLFDAGAQARAGEMIPPAYNETTQLAEMFPKAEVISKPPTNVSELLWRMQSASIFHFVGHAISDGGSAQLILAAPPKAVRLTALNLEGVRLANCRLAFLAGCTTSGEEPRRAEEAFALPSGFLRAGVRDVVASRWNVDSEASRALAVEFYSHVLKGESPATALMRAQGTLLAKPRFQHPYYWSAFCLVEQ